MRTLRLASGVSFCHTGAHMSKTAKYGSGPAGATVSVPHASSDGGVDAVAATLFGESASRAIVSVDSDRLETVLAAARAALAAEILPALPAGLRYTGLMVANALAIAERELIAGDTAAGAERERVRALLAEHSDPAAAETLAAALARYNRHLAGDIRAGRFDGELRSMLSGVQSSGVVLPAPPPLYQDILGSSLNLNFQCTVQKACE